MNIRFKILIRVFGVLTAAAVLFFALYPVMKKNYDRGSIPGLVENSHSVYVFGDSTTLYSTDIEALKRVSGREVISYAQAGSGVLDFLVFSELMPQSCNALVGLSYAMLARPFSRDFSRSGLTFQSVLFAFSNMKISELAEYIKNNSSPYSAVRRVKGLKFPVQGHLVRKAEPKLVEGYTRAVNLDRFSNKANAFFEGVENLIDKKCNIAIVVPPWSPDMNRIVNSSPYRNIFEGHVARLNSKLKFKVDIVSLPGQSGIYYDLTHLNARGNQLYTQYLLENVFPKFSVKN